jgi:hypothetical protein
MVIKGISYPLLGFLCHLELGLQVEGDTHGVCIATHSPRKVAVGYFIGQLIDKNQIGQFISIVHISLNLEPCRDSVRTSAHMTSVGQYCRLM